MLLKWRFKSANVLRMEDLFDDINHQRRYLLARACREARLGRLLTSCLRYGAYSYNSGYLVTARINCAAARDTGAMRTLGARCRSLPLPLHNHASPGSINFTSVSSVRALGDMLGENLDRAQRPEALTAWLGCVRLLGRGHTAAERSAAIERLALAQEAEPPIPLFSFSVRHFNPDF